MRGSSSDCSLASGSRCGLPLAVIARDSSQKIQAGLYGKSYWKWLYMNSCGFLSNIADQAWDPKNGQLERNVLFADLHAKYRREPEWIPFLISKQL